MEIACLGWGSLIWNPGSLNLASGWKCDGPELPIEFARESSDGRITLVLVEGLKKSSALWAMLHAVNIESAKAELARREGVAQHNIKHSIGYWDFNSDISNGKCSEEIAIWGEEKGLDGVVWTNLKYGLRASRDVLPNIIDIEEHLNSLSGTQRDIAEEYVRKTPTQIQTQFRSELEQRMGWYPLR